MQVASSFMSNPVQDILNTFTCDGCGRKVKETEMVIPIGPMKGEKTIVNIGCKCEDIKIAEESKKHRNYLKTSKMKKIFDSNSLINRSLTNATFESYEPTSKGLAKVKEDLVDYTKSFNVNTSNNVLLVGGYGTGKSHLSVSVTKKLMDQGHSCVFLSVPKLLTKIKNTYNKNSKHSEDELLEMIESVDLLVLDDLGTEHANDRGTGDSWTHTKLFEVLDGRSGKPTIFTTNLEGDELEGKFNERNMSRIMDNTQVIKVVGNDYRRKEF